MIRFCEEPERSGVGDKRVQVYLQERYLGQGTGDEDTKITQKELKDPKWRPLRAGGGGDDAGQWGGGVKSGMCREDQN